MAQIFGKASNSFARVGLVGGILGIFGLLWANYAVYWSSWTTRVGMPLDQPGAPFSHKHHVTDDGIDCRYCHTSVENSSFAGIPPTETCMTCHSQLFTGAPVLAKVRESYATQTRLRWNRVDDLPDFVFFNHSIHINKGVGCSSCHGPVDAMPLVWKNYSMYMKWCLDCHRDPAKFLRPQDQIFNLDWAPPADQREQGQKLLQANHIPITQLRDCSMCHR